MLPEPQAPEFASKQAPEGREGLYLGYAHMNTFFAWLFGFVFAGFMLKAFCPHPSTMPVDAQVQHARGARGRGPDAGCLRARALPLVRVRRGRSGVADRHDRVHRGHQPVA